MEGRLFGKYIINIIKIGRCMLTVADAFYCADGSLAFLIVVSVTAN